MADIRVRVEAEGEAIDNILSLLPFFMRSQIILGTYVQQWFQFIDFYKS
jgi:hypothetical protein